MSEQTIFRISKNKDNPYVMINKEFLSDTNLSWKAKGILSYMLSLPDDWKIYETEIIKHSADGRASTRAGIKELIDNNYIHREQMRAENGKFKGYKYTVYEKPYHIRFSDNGELDNRFSNTTNNNLTNNKKNNISTPQQAVVDMFEDIETKELVESISIYCMHRFNEPLRTPKKSCYEFDTLSYLPTDELYDVLNTLSKDQCNLDYLEVIQDRYR